MQIICKSHTIYIPWRGEERGGEERRGEERRGWERREEERRGEESRGERKDMSKVGQEKEKGNEDEE